MQKQAIRADFRAHAEVVDAGFSSPCWLWTRNLNSQGYAQFHGEDGMPHYVHRALYEAQHGPIPAPLELDHLCRNRRCVNPEHLEAVTRRENARRGARAKITADDAAVIRESTLSNLTLGKMYGLHPATISRIKSGQRWAEDAR
jgi:hypothetical protein